MKRRPASSRRHKKQFHKTAKRIHPRNRPSGMRGGWRL